MVKVDDSVRRKLGRDVMDLRGVLREEALGIAGVADPERLDGEGRGRRVLPKEANE